MNKLQTFEQFLATNSPDINLLSLVTALVLAAILSFILKKIYVKYGTALSNREKFANNFIILATTTTLIITIIKSSLALSLGLVGALSIVRFRAAIKEPEELGFLFLTISIGLGLGANQFSITIISFIIIVYMLILFRKSTKKEKECENLSLTIRSERPNKIDLNDITNVLKKHCSLVNLKRLDETSNLFEASFFIKFDSFSNFNEAKNELKELSRSISLTYLERE